ncbi:MAG: GH116 family glycosyl hydrolase [Pirellulales bacterium]
MRPRKPSLHADSQNQPNACCSQGGCGGKLDRREFSKFLGLGAASLVSLGADLPVMAGPFENASIDPGHRVPANKKLSAEWLRGLFERGTTRVCRGKELDAIGMPVGGIGTGQLYLRGDGTLGYWAIFNRTDFSGYGATNYAMRAPASPIEQGFSVAVEADGKTESRELNCRGFTGVEFTGEYPIGTVRYQTDGFPIKVQMEAFSPFIPLNAKDSALPATVFRLTVENASAKPLRVAISGRLENAVCFHSGGAAPVVRRSRVIREKGRTLVAHTAASPPQKAAAAPREAIVLADFEGADYGAWKAAGKAFGSKPATGTLASQQAVSGFAGKGLVNSFLGGDEPQGTLTSPPVVISRKFLNFLMGGGGQAGATCMNLVVGGKAVRTATGQDKETLVWHSWNVEEFEGKEARLEIVDCASGPWGHINVDQIELADQSRQGPNRPVEQLEDFGSMTLAFLGAAAVDTSGGLASVAPGAPAAPAGDGSQEIDLPAGQRPVVAVASPAVELAPGGKHAWTFVLAWHFPNAENGHEYAARFQNAAEVANYVLDHHDRLSADTRKWHDTYYDSTLPHWLLDRLHSTVSYLATGTCQWWKSGRFWAWEGVGCCNGTCTHVWNYEHAMARLFPELERSAREMQDFGAGFDPQSGVVGFRSDRAYAADGQCGTILKAYREHQMSADDAFLKRNWPRIKKALEFSIRQDANDDGLIEGSQPNTYDIDFFGPNTFVGSLYLAALRAGEEMAREMADVEFAGRLRKIFESGRRLSAEKLFNGEYFGQIVDLAKHPKDQYGDGCLSDQLFGQGWAAQVGLGAIYSPQMVKKALESVWKYNWAPDIGPQNAVHRPERWFVSPGEAGLFICTWPRSKHLADSGVRYRDEVWTGIEYQVAGNMVWEGMLTEALAICRAIHDRYDPARRNPWNEVECGDHYARAMASWGVFTALAGYEYHGPKGHLGFAPRLSPEDFRAAFTAAEGWGTLSQKREGTKQTERIEVRWGRLAVRTLAFAVAGDRKTANAVVTLAGKPVEAACEIQDGRVKVSLASAVSLKEGEALEVAIQ